MFIMLSICAQNVMAGLYECNVKASYRTVLEDDNLHVFVRTRRDRKTLIFGAAPQIIELNNIELQKIEDVVFLPTFIMRLCREPLATTPYCVEAMHEALIRTMQDSEIIGVELNIKVDFSSMSGEEVTQVIKNIQAAYHDILIQAQQPN